MSIVRCAASLLVLLLALPAHAHHQANAPTTFEDVARRAAAAREAGRADDALKLYREGLAKNADWDEGRWYVGTLLYELERYTEAGRAFAELVRRQPDHAGAIAMRGLCEFQAARYQEALRSLMRARELGVAHVPGIATVVRYHAAILLARFGEFEVASAVLSEAGMEVQESPPLIDAFGLVLLRLRLLPSEVPASQRPLVALAGRAGLAMTARRAAVAKAAFDDLVARYPKTPNVHYARGAFRLTETPDLALEDFARELALDPNHLLACLQTALEWLRRGDTAKAREYAARAVTINGESAAARLALGQVLLEASEIPAAIAELELAVKLAPASAQAHFVLARAYARAGRDADAERERREFTRLDNLAKGRR